MVIMVNRLNQLYDLVGGAITILKNMSSSMGRDYPIYELEKRKNIHVPNHQPGIVSIYRGSFFIRVSPPFF